MTELALHKYHYPARADEKLAGKTTNFNKHKYMANCPNCGSELSGEYCAACGQQDVTYQRPIWSLITSVVTETFEVDGRTANTIKMLLTRPGGLTAEYLSGRRKTYTPPLRLYLVFSIGFFLLIAWFASSEILRDPNVDPALRSFSSRDLISQNSKPPLFF